MSGRKFVKKLSVKPQNIAAPTTVKPKKIPRKKLYQAGEPNSIEALNIKTNISLDEYNITEHIDKEPELKSIIGIKVTWLGSQEVKDRSTVEIRNNKTEGPNSVYDPALGVIQNLKECVVCSQNWKACPGHPGHIVIPPCPHPAALKEICNILDCFCSKCHRLLLPLAYMKLLEITRYKGENRFRAYQKEVKKVLQCKNKITKNEECSEPTGKYTVVDDKFYKTYKSKKETRKQPVGYDEVVEILQNIRDTEFKLLGFEDNEHCHPRNMIISNLCVLQPSARPYVEAMSQRSHDDLTHKYGDINKSAVILSRGETEMGTMDEMDRLFFHLKTMMDNSKGKAKESRGGSRTIRAIKQRINGKGGLIRQNIQGKRIACCGRSVISPNPNLHLNQVGVPKYIADKLTFQVPVNLINLNECQKLVNKGEVLYVRRGTKTINMKYATKTKGFKLLYGDVVIRNGVRIRPDNEQTFILQYGDSVLRTHFTECLDGTLEVTQELIKNVEVSKAVSFIVRIGDIIERKLQNKDIAIFNRQPTLHESSIKGKEVVIIPDKTFQMELSNTQSWGADFDGDEMNLKPCNSYASREEVFSLMSIEAQFINPAENKPTIVIKQDNMLAGYLFTLGIVKIDKTWIMDCVCMMDIEFDKIHKRMEEIKETYKWLKYEEDMLYTGYGLFSILFPSDFHYNDGKLKISRGVMINGPFTKQNIHHMIHHIYKDYGAKFACDLITYYQRFTNILIVRRGFSVGLQDCLPVNEEMIKSEQEKSFLQAKMVMENEKDLEIRESKIQSILNQSIDIGERIIREGIAKDNNYLHMILSGSKGALFNYVNCVNSVGQQNLTGKRAVKDYGGRTLPCYPKQGGKTWDEVCDVKDLPELFKSRAYIMSSFFEGLSSVELFFLSVAGREGLSDIALKTSKCGYISRRLVKNMEDVKIGYNSMVVNASGSVIQFCYGDDNYSGAELIKTKHGLQCSDISHIVDCLNEEFEWDQSHPKKKEVKVEVKKEEIKKLVLLEEDLEEY